MLKLIINDIKLYKSGLAVVLLYAVIYLFGFHNSNAFSMSVGVFTVYMFVVGILNMEERDGIDLLHRCLPVTVKQIVGAKYLESLLICFFYAVILIIAQTVFIFMGSDKGFVQALSSILLTVSISLIFCSVSIPLIYRFGFAKSRIILLLIFSFTVAVTAGILSISMVNTGVLNFHFAHITALLLAAVGMAVSYPLSVRIYRRKA